MRTSTKTFGMGGLSLLVLLALGCGGSGGGSSAPSAESTAIYLQDAAPQTITANQVPRFQMQELWLTINGVGLRETNGRFHQLALAQSPLVVDVMTLDNSSVLLGWATSFPAGHYKALELSISAAEMRGTDLQTNQAATESLQLSGFSFEAEFKPAHAWLDPASPTAIVVDWQPAVSATVDAAGNVTYTLDDEVHAFVVGSNPAGAQGPRPLRDLEGRIATIDCAANTLTVVHGQHVPVTVSFTAQTRLLDDDGNPLAGGCADMNVGDKVEIDGHLQPGNSVLATTIKDESAGGHNGTDFERRGIADQVQTGVMPRFELRIGSHVIAEIMTDADTDYEFDDHHRNHGQAVDPAQDIFDGVFLKVEGTVTGTNAAGLPTVLAEEIEIK